MTGSKPPPRVALVDDEEDITTFLRLALEDAGCAVAVCNRADDALGVLREFRPDLVCLDLLMPGRTGASLYAEMAGDPELGGVPVLILSGLGARDDLPDILARGGGEAPPPAGYLEKPIDAAGFLRLVRSLLGARGEAPR